MDLETHQLRQLLSEQHQLPEVLLLKQTTTSTNDDVRECAQKGISSILVSSAQQTQGRGQRQRQWVSPEGNIYLSTLLQSRPPIDGRLALEIALNILQMPSLQSLALQVKWPNDLYSAQGKWGGILIEPLSPHQTIVGVGINMAAMSAHQLDQQVTSLPELGLAHPNRVQLTAELYLAIQQAGQWFNHGCPNLAQRFNRHASFMGDAVAFEHHHGLTEGIFRGIVDDGAVQIETTEGLQAFYQGRLRRLA